MLGVSLLVVAHLSFASLFSRLFLPVPRLSSSANRSPVRVVIRSCGAHVLHRAAPTPTVSSWISTPGDGRRLRFGVACVVTLRQQPQATGDQAWDECSSRGDDRRSDAGPRRSRCSRCRGQACGRRARRPTDGGGTAPQVPAQVRVGDDRRFTASGPIRLTVHRSQPVLPSAASTRAWSAVARKSASDRVQIAVTAGRARECSRRSRSTADARRRAFARHPPGGRTNMLPKGSSQLAACAQQAPEPIAGCLGPASPTTANCGSCPFRPSSVLLSPFSPSSRYFLLRGPVRPSGGRYLSDAGSLRSAPVGRANMLPSRGSTRCLRAAGSGTDSRLPRWRFTNDRRPRLLTFPSIVRPPFSRFTVFSLFPPSWSCPAARRPVPQWRRFGSIGTCLVAAR